MKKFRRVLVAGIFEADSFAIAGIYFQLFISLFAVEIRNCQ